MGIYYRGYRAGTWIFLAMTFVGILFCFSRPIMAGKGNMALLPAVIITTISIGISSLLISNVLINYREGWIYEDNRYRLEKTGWFITPCRLPALFVKKGLFERELKYEKEGYCLTKGQIDSVSIAEIGDGTVNIAFYHHGDILDYPNPIEVVAVSRYPKLKTIKPKRFYFGLYFASSIIFVAGVRMISSGFISAFFSTNFFTICQPIHCPRLPGENSGEKPCVNGASPI